MDDHALAAEAARRAGDFLVELRARGGDRRRRRPAGRRPDPRRSSREHRPDDAVLSEESKDDPARLDAERVWIVDPLDGTREYGEAGPHRLGGARRARRRPDARSPRPSRCPPRASCSSTEPAPTLAPATDGPIRMLVSRTRPPELATHLAELLDAELVPWARPAPRRWRCVLGVGDVYAHGGGQYEWDSAAPVGVADAAGCHAPASTARRCVYNQPDPYLPDLLVCRPELADQVLAAIARDR